MSTSVIKNKTTVFSFHGKVFLNTIIALLVFTLISCSKEQGIIPEDNEFAEHPRWTGNTIDKDVRNSILGASNYQLDIDADGENDFNVQFYINPDGTYSITLFGNGDNKVVSSDSNIIKSFALKEVINSKSKTWKNGAHLIVNNGATILQPATNSTGTVIAGIHFKKDAKMHYGYLRFRIGLARGFIHVIYFDDYVYEVAENKGIKAGIRNDV